MKHQHLPMPVIVNVSRQFVPRKYLEDFHVDGAHELLHVIMGKVRLHLESGEDYIAEKNETLLIPQGLRHRDIFEIETGLEVFIIHFKWGMAKKFFAAAAPDCLKKLSPKDGNELLLLLDMFRLDRYSEPENLTLAEGRLAHLLGIAWRHVFSGGSEISANDSYSRLASYAYNYMAAHLSEAINLEHVAAYCKVSRATLLRAFRRSSGLSFNAALRAMRMNVAYSLLKERALNTGECAKRCGYADPAYFSRVFKKHFGFSPKNIT